MSRKRENVRCLIQVFPLVLLTAVTLLPLSAFVVMKAIESGFCSGKKEIKLDDELMSAFIPPLTPWASIGGCGAGGSGSGGGNDGIRWLGMGVSGGLIDIEVLSRMNINQDYRSFSISPRLSFKPSWTTELGITLPVMSKTGEVQYQTNDEPFDRTTGGLGDIEIDFSKRFGMSGEYDASLSLSLPTGQYDIKRGSERDERFLPARLQKGSGLYNASLSVSRTFDVNDEFLIAEASYEHPFNARPFSAENQMLDTYYSAYKDRTGSKRFYYRGKAYGENDLGAYTPPAVSLSAYYGYKGIDNYVHSWGFSFNAPMGVAWISSEKTEIYDPRPDPDHTAWNATFTYGLEFSRPKFPIFMAVSLPVSDRKNGPGDDIYDSSPMKKWDWPDWNSLLNEWTFAIGFKSTMF